MWTDLAGEIAAETKRVQQRAKPRTGVHLLIGGEAEATDADPATADATRYGPAGVQHFAVELLTAGADGVVGHPITPELLPTGCGISKATLTTDRTRSACCGVPIQIGIRCCIASHSVRDLWP